MVKIVKLKYLCILSLASGGQSGREASAINYLIRSPVSESTKLGGWLRRCLEIPQSRFILKFSPVASV